MKDVGWEKLCSSEINEFHIRLELVLLCPPSRNSITFFHSFFTLPPTFSEFFAHSADIDCLIFFSSTLFQSTHNWNCTTWKEKLSRKMETNTSLSKAPISESTKSVKYRCSLKTYSKAIQNWVSGVDFLRIKEEKIFDFLKIRAKKSH